jgi:hypothetical protein
MILRRCGYASLKLTFTIILFLSAIGSLIILQSSLAQENKVLVKPTGDCSQEAPQSIDPIEMTSIIDVSAVKGAKASSMGYMRTVHIQNTAFTCFTGNNPGMIVDVTLLTQIFGSAHGPEFYPNEARFSLTECRLNLDGNFISCDSSPVPNRQENLTNCFELSVPSPPIKMNTVVVNSSIAKSITAKEFTYSCSSSTQKNEIKLKEVTMFTSLFKSSNFTSSSFMATTCIRDVKAASIESCYVSLK